MRAAPYDAQSTAAHLGARRPFLWQYIRDQRQLDRQHREEQILLAVQQAIGLLYSQGEQVSIRTVSRVTGYSMDLLKRRRQIQTSLATTAETM